VHAIVEPFFDDVASLQAACDLVVSRAGATTVAEIAVVGRPAVLVPYPHATEGHQLANARALERAGAAIVIEDSRFTADALVSTVRDLLSDRERLAAMGERARALARPDAAARLARSVLAAAGSGPTSRDDGDPVHSSDDWRH
jgi:UDP-N-acetylglucosamine--N-acetylmuramyl-(pentapeptide) pyrophosphoryl-undecaprenol N-acetylglucosamine transferase